MKRLLALRGAFLLLTALSTSQTSTPDWNKVDPRPGLIKADSSLYELDVAVDMAMVSVGLKKVSDAVHERASEAVVAAEADDQHAVDQAVEEAQHMAQIAHGVNDGGLKETETLLREVRDRTPEEAHTGLDTAIDNVIEAQGRLPTDLPAEPRVPDRLNIGVTDSMVHNKRGPVTTPGDLISRTIKDEKGRRYTYAKFFRVGGAGAKREVQQEGKRMKANQEIRNYRVEKYWNVRVLRYPDGRFTRNTIIRGDISGEQPGRGTVADQSTSHMD